MELIIFCFFYLVNSLAGSDYGQIWLDIEVRLLLRISLLLYRKQLMKSWFEAWDRNSHHDVYLFTLGHYILGRPLIKPAVL